MKRLVGILAASMLLVGFMALPAQAVRHAKNCTTRTTGNQERTICSYVNTSNVTLQEYIEGLMDMLEAPGIDPVQIEIDFVKLYHCPVPGGCNLKTQWTGTNGFINAPFCNGDGCGDDTRGTARADGWYYVCPEPRDAGTFHSDVRARVKWTTLPGDPIGPWFLLHSGNSVETCS